LTNPHAPIHHIPTLCKRAITTILSKSDKKLMDSIRKKEDTLYKKSPKRYHHNLKTALDNMVVPAVLLFSRVHFPFLNPKYMTETLILGFFKSPKFCPIYLSLDPRGLLSVNSEQGEPSMGPGSTT
jgi:hypothetical protein